MTRRTPLVALSLALIAAQAFGHTKLQSSVPSADSAVAPPVKEIVLEFAEPVRVTAVTLANAAGTAQPLGAIAKDTTAKLVIEVREPLAAGSYVISWRVVGADTHVVSGEIAFSVAGAAHSH